MKPLDDRENTNKVAGMLYEAAGNGRLEAEQVTADSDPVEEVDMFKALLDAQARLGTDPHQSWDKTEKQRGKNALRHVQDYVMASSKAMAVFTTPKYIGAKAIRTHFGDICKRDNTGFMVMFEEATKILELDTIMFCKLANLAYMVSFSLCGGAKQMENLILSALSKLRINEFSSQMEYSLLTRLILQGFPCAQLT